MLVRYLTVPGVDQVLCSSCPFTLAEGLPCEDGNWGPQGRRK